MLLHRMITSLFLLNTLLLPKLQRKINFGAHANKWTNENIAVFVRQKRAAVGILGAFF